MLQNQSVVLHEITKKESCMMAEYSDNFFCLTLH